jgi:hypothetical protein
MRTVVLVLLAIGCASSQRTKVIGGTLAGVDASALALTTYSHQHTEELIASAPSLEQGKALIADWRAKVDRLELAVDAVYRLIAVAALANDDASVANAVQAAKVVADEIRDLRSKP